MKFLVDQNLPATLCNWLAARNQSSEHIRLLGMRDATDEDIIARARETGAILKTREKDFIPRAGGDTLAMWFQVVWIRAGNTANDALLSALDSAWTDLIAALERGDPVVE